MGLFGDSPQEKYQKYLNWFADNVKDPNNWSWMRADRDCQNWQTKNGDGKPIDPGTPIPYSMGEALFMMGDPKKMAKALSKKIESNHKKYTEMSKYINGDPDQGEINPEYQENMKVLKATQEEIKRSYGTSTELSNKQIKKMVDKNKELEQQKKEGMWVPLSQWEAFKHFISGNKVESQETQIPDWRDYHNAKEKK
jgi:hypothetical protein